MSERTAQTPEQAMILAGGLATRLGDLAGSIPKPLLPVAGRPFVTYLLEQLSRAGIRQVILCTGHLSEVIKETLGSSYGDMELVYSKETQPLGTGGALRLAHPFIETPSVFVLNGDSYVHTDLSDFATRSKTRNSILTVKVKDTSRFGSLKFDSDGHIEEFVEKANSGGSGWINGGIYLLSRESIGEFALNRPLSLERDIFPTFLETGFYAWPCEGEFIDIGTPDSLFAAESFFNSLDKLY